MDDNRSPREHSSKKRRHEQEEPSLSTEEVDIDTVLREFFEDEENARRYQTTPVKIPSCCFGDNKDDTKMSKTSNVVIDDEKPGPSGLHPVRIPSCCYGDNKGDIKESKTSKVVINDEKPGPSGLQPAVSLAEREVYLYDLHRCDSEVNLTPEERKELLAIQALGDGQGYSGADIGSSSSYEDLTNGQKNIDPPEPEWPADRPIKPGDILYMMFHRPEKDKEAEIADTIADEKDDKPTLTKSDKEDNKSKEEILAEIKQRVEERINAYSSIQRLHEDIEKSSTYVPDARLSSSCFSQCNIHNKLAARSRSEIYITARHSDDAFLDKVITHQSISSQALEEEFNDRPSGRKTAKRPAEGEINTRTTKRPVRAEQPRGIPYERLFNVTEAKKQAQERMKNGISTGAYGVGQPSSYSVQSKVKVNEDQKQDRVHTNNQAAPKHFGQSPGIPAQKQTNPIETNIQAQELLFNDSVGINDSLGQSPDIFPQSLVDANDVQLQGPSDASYLYGYQPLIPTINIANPGFCQNGSYNAQTDTPLGMDQLSKMSDMKKTSSPADLRDSVDKCLAKLNKEYAKKATRKRKRSIDWKNFNDVTIENDNDFYRYGPKRQRRDSDSNSTVSFDEPVKMDVTPPPPPPFKYPVADAATRRYFEKVIALRDGRPPISSESKTKKKKSTRSRRPSTRRN